MQQKGGMNINTSEKKVLQEKKEMEKSSRCGRNALQIQRTVACVMSVCLCEGECVGVKKRPHSKMH
jgi:hypothetical protein